MNNTNAVGRSMIEMLGVLAVVGILSAGAMVGYSKAMAKYKADKTIKQMSQIITNISTVYAQQGRDYKGLDNIAAIRLGVVPTEMIVNAATGEIKNLYQGSVTIKGKIDGETFSVIFDKLPKEVSITLGTLDWGVDDRSGLQGVKLMKTGRGESE